MIGIARVEILGLLLTTAASTGIHCRYSTLSGPVCQVTIGDQEIGLSVLFGQETDVSNFLFANVACPPFVPRCYDMDGSESFEIIEEGFFQNAAIGWSGDVRIRESVISEDRFAEFTIAHTSGDRCHNGARFRDVAGAISLSSLLGDGLLRPIEFRPTTDGLGFIMQPVGDVAVKPTTEETAVTTVTLSSDGPSIQARMVFDASIDRMLISESLLQQLGTLVTCESQLRLGLGSLGEIIIPSNQLVVTTELDCTLHADTFITDTPEIRIGRQLINSVSSLSVLSGRIVGFRPISVALEAIVPVSPLIPTFSFPVVQKETETVRIVFPRAGPTGSRLVLLSEVPITESAGKAVYRFVRHSAATVPPLQQQADGLYIIERVGLEAETQGFEFRGRKRSLLTDNEMRVFTMTIIYVGELYVDVVIQVMTPAVRLEALELPAPVVASGGSDCSVCLHEIEEGQREQRMEHCIHRFHVACVRRWLENVKRNCPVCRSEAEINPERNMGISAAMQVLL